jgi:hypothetical protein
MQTTASAPTSVVNLLNDSPILAYFMALAALSLVSMSVLQALKNLLPIRYAFQGWFFRRWLRRHAQIAHDRLGLTAAMDGKQIDRMHIVRVLGTARNWVADKMQKSGQIERDEIEQPVLLAKAQTEMDGQEHDWKHTVHVLDTVRNQVANKIPKRRQVRGDEIDQLVMRAEAETVFLAADGSAVALFNADGDDFIKLFGAAAQMVVDFPREYGVLLTMIACNMQESDFRILTSLEKIAGEKNKQGHDPILEAPKPAPPRPEPILNQPFLEAKNRVRMQVVEAVSAYQLRSNWGWGTIMRVSSFGISLGLALAGERLIYSKRYGLETWATALLAAFLASVARDLVATIEKLRSG